MLCRLCEEEQKLTKAHIMPDSMNRVLRTVLGDDPNSPMLTIEKGSGKTKPYPMGVYDKTIICGPCDGTFSLWEQHGTDILFTKHQWKDVRYDRARRPACYTLLNADYAALKLFVLSMLWKTAASDLPYCRGVTLPPEKMEELRQMLVASDPGPASQFAVRIAHFYAVDAPMTFESHMEHIDGIEYAVMYVPGYKLFVQVDDQQLPASHAFVISPGSEIRVGLINFVGSPERRAVEKMAAKL